VDYHLDRRRHRASRICAAATAPACPPSWSPRTAPQPREAANAKNIQVLNKRQAAGGAAGLRQWRIQRVAAAE
jgi:hypothetical protein